MKFRHELKHRINYSDMVSLRSRLSAVCSCDQNAARNGGSYRIRSLYFDDMFDTALREKINSVNKREKFRIRYYNGNTSFIKLEKKSKVNGLCNKVTAVITCEEADMLARGDIETLKNSEKELVRELCMKMTTRGLRAKVIVEYTREPFTFSPGNVRVTLDYDIRTGLRCTDFLNPDCVMIPAIEPGPVLEVKWDEYLPEVIRQAVQLEGRRHAAFSKYAISRMYE